MVQLVRNLFSQNTLNKKVDQLFVGAGINQSIYLGRRKRWRPWVFGILFCMLIGACVLAWIFWRHPLPPLAKHMPHDVPIYVYVRDMHPNKWYSSLLFWEPSAQARQEMVLAIMAREPFGGESVTLALLAPYYSGSVEYARTASDIGILALNGVSEQAWRVYAATYKTMQEVVVDAGAYAEFSDSKALYWRIKNRVLYISHDPLLLTTLTNSAESAGKAAFARMDNMPFGLVYIGSAMQTEGPLRAALASVPNSAFPITLGIRVSGNMLVFSSDASAVDVRANESAVALPETDISTVLHINSAQEALALLSEDSARDSLFSGNIRALRGSLEYLFGSTVGQATSTLRHMPVSVAVSMQNNAHTWLVVVHDSGEHADIATLLRSVAEHITAYQNPLVRSVLLRDGSRMDEYYVDISNMAWHGEDIAAPGADLIFDALSHNNTPTQYLTGLLPGYGYILTNSKAMLTRFAAKPDALFAPALSCGTSMAGKSFVSLARENPFFSYGRYLNANFLHVGVNQAHDMVGCFAF